MPLLAVGDDQSGRRIASRVANLAMATTQDARLHVLGDGEAVTEDSVLFRFCGAECQSAVPGRPHVRVDEPDVLAARLTTAVAIVGVNRREVVLELGGDDFW